MSQPPRSCRRPAPPPRWPTSEAAEVGGLLAVAREAGVERTVGVVAGEGEVVVAVLRRGPRDDLAVRLQHHAVRLVASPEVGRLLAVAGEARVERAVGVVAGEGEVVAVELRLRRQRRRSCRRLGLPPRFPDRSRRCPRSPSIACRPRKSSCRASRSGCNGRARRRRRCGPPRRSCHRLGAPHRSQSRSRGSPACRRRRSSCRVSRSGCSGRARSPSSNSGRRRRRSCRPAGARSLTRCCHRSRSRPSACRRRRRSGRGPQGHLAALAEKKTPTTKAASTAAPLLTDVRALILSAHSHHPAEGFHANLPPEPQESKSAREQPGLQRETELGA